MRYVKAAPEGAAKVATQSFAMSDGDQKAAFGNLELGADDALVCANDGRLFLCGTTEALAADARSVFYVVPKSALAELGLGDTEIGAAA